MRSSRCRRRGDWARSQSLSWLGERLQYKGESEPQPEEQLVKADGSTGGSVSSEVVAQAPIELELTVGADAVVLELHQVPELAREPELDPGEQHRAALHDRLRAAVEADRV